MIYYPLTTRFEILAFLKTLKVAVMLSGPKSHLAQFFSKELVPLRIFGVFSRANPKSGEGGGGVPRNTIRQNEY